VRARDAGATTEGMTTVRPFLMFEGQAEAAMSFYVSLFEDGEILQLERHGADAGAAAGKVLRGSFSIGGLTVMVFDSPVSHGFTFTPASSLFVDFTTEAALDRAYEALLAGGSALMPLGAYGFSRKFGWVNDRYGVSWQLNLP
jgi:predicted 3-demethylubiquinone-9 3-methyltransferase (glyoxalase superfamily)